MRYEDLLLKQPLESATYKEDSEFVITQVRKILDRQKETGDDKNNKYEFKNGSAS